LKTRRLVAGANRRYLEFISARSSHPDVPRCGGCLKKETSFVVVSMRRMRPKLSYILIETGPHVMADASALNTGVEVVAELGAEVPGEAPAKEGGDMLGLDGVDRGAADRLVQ
jgi:hypothetical protein